MASACRRYTRPQCEFVARFIGRNTILTGKLHGHADGIAGVTTAAGLLRGRLNGAAPSKGASVVLSIPSEAVDVTDAASPPDRRERLPARLVSRLLIGTAVQLTMVLQDGQEVSVESHVSKYPRGWAPDAVVLSWDPADATVLAIQ